MSNCSDLSQSRAEAEMLALRALQFIAEDGKRLERFLTLTGMEPADLRANAGEAEVMAAVLGFLLEDESLLLVFASMAGVAPETVGKAHREIAGRQPEWGG